jgi:N-acetylmuramic acid 6-phosphate etherase
MIQTSGGAQTMNWLSHNCAIRMTRLNLALSMTLPPDRGHISTEHRHPASHELDAMDTIDVVRFMADDHRAVIEAVEQAASAIASFVDNLAPRIEQGGRLIYLGAGTSGRLGVLDAAECPPTFQADPLQIVGIIAGGDASLRKSSESKEDEPDGALDALDELSIGERDTVLGIAAGGTTPYVLGGLRHAKARGAMTGLLTCAATSNPLENCDHLLFLPTGAELLTGSTRLKAGTATKLTLNIITTTLFIKLGKVYSNLMVDLRATNAKLRDRAIRILRELCPTLSREQAASAIDDAGGDLKVAIVMQRLSISRNDACARLVEHNRRLRAALEASD